jgi:phage terminase large subunit GpA-like protein
MPGGKNSIPQIYWMVGGAGTDFSGSTVSYGIIKGRERKSEAEVLECLDKAAESVVGREWLRDDGLGMRVTRALVDSGDETELIYQWVRRVRFQGEVYASKGEGAPRDLAHRKPGRRIGERWVLGNPPDGRRIRLMRFDTNYWKTFAAARLSLPVGVPGSFSLPGSEPKSHRVLSEHLASEYPLKEQVGDVLMTKWKKRPNVANHWWDCFVGCMVALSEQGCVLNLASGDGPVTRKTSRPKRNGWFKK